MMNNIFYNFNKKNIAYFIIALYFLVIYSCKEHKEKEIKEVVIKKVNPYILTFVDVDCNKFNTAFKEDSETIKIKNITEIEKIVTKFSHLK